MNKNTFKEIEMLVADAEVYFVDESGKVVNVRAVDACPDGGLVFAADKIDLDEYRRTARR